jgi:hypothetical protein
MTIRIYYQKLGVHYHCRVFTSMAPAATFVKSGDLVFRESEWDAIREIWNGTCHFLPDSARHVDADVRRR